MTWDSLDWKTLDRLRGVFLSEKPARGSYWTSPSDLENYDFTFGQRIAWKWDAVLRELQLRGWHPPSAPLLDWGCGSGVAARRVVDFFGAARFPLLRLFDRARLAVDFAAEAARAEFPALRAEPADWTWLQSAEPVGVLVLSHVLGELASAGKDALARLILRADAVLWVEPGSHTASRSLIEMRERLRGEFVAVAPCTHQAPCGLLAPGNERHWCHHFAAPPPGIMSDPDWVRFAQRAGLDLRSLPYSFLVLERRGLREPEPAWVGEGWSRQLGGSRFFKGVVKVFSCQKDGVRELTLQKRAAPGLFQQLQESSQSPIRKWQLADGRITGHEPWTRDSAKHLSPAGAASAARANRREPCP